MAGRRATRMRRRERSNGWLDTRRSGEVSFKEKDDDDDDDRDDRAELAFGRKFNSFDVSARMPEWSLALPSRTTG